MASDLLGGTCSIRMAWQSRMSVLQYLSYVVECGLWTVAVD
jgi:hypothetical protein